MRLVLSAATAGSSLAVWTDAKELKPMGLDPEARPAGHIAGDRRHPARLDLGRALAHRADHVMVVNRLAFNVGVVPAGQIDPLDRVQLGEQLKGPEDRGPADIELLAARVIDQVGGGEMAVPFGDQASHDAARLGQPIASPVEAGDDRRGVGHWPTIPRIKPNPGSLLTILSLI